MRDCIEARADWSRVRAFTVLLQIKFDSTKSSVGKAGPLLVCSIRCANLRSNCTASPSGRFPGFELKISVFRDGLHIASCHDTLDQAPLRAGHFISRFNIPARYLQTGHVYSRNWRYWNRLVVGLGVQTSLPWTFRKAWRGALPIAVVASSGFPIRHNAFNRIS